MAKYRSKPKSTKVLRFDTWEQFIQAASRPHTWDTPTINVTSERRTEFTGTKSLSEALNLALYGWKEGREMMVDAGLTATAEPKFEHGETRDVAGDYPDVQAAIAGDPCSMVCMGDQHIAAKPVLRIVASVHYPSSLDSEAIVNHGIALLSAVDKLETSGYSVELSLTMAASTSIDNREKTRAIDCRAVFKRAGDPLDLDRAAFALANPSVARRLFFAIMESYPELEILAGGMGYPGPGEIDDGSVAIPPADHSCHDPKTAMQRIVEALQLNNVTIDWMEQ